MSDKIRCTITQLPDCFNSDPGDQARAENGCDTCRVEAMCQPTRCTITPTLEAGDLITIAGDYERRTFWEWLRNKPRRLKVYTLKNNTCQVEK